MEPRSPPPPPARLLDQLRERLRYLHYSLRTERAYVYWVRFFIRWSGLRHPKSMGKVEVEQLLNHLTSERNVAVSTHKQALAALLFLYREVLSQELPWMTEIARPSSPKRIPAVLSVEEVGRALKQMSGATGLLARLLYGTGMRLNEALQLRVKDIDFTHRVIVIRQAKGKKDRIVMLPQSILLAIRSVQELLGHRDVSTTMIYTHVLRFGAGAVTSPLDLNPSASTISPH